MQQTTKRGASFKGALAYYLHDKKLEGERERFTSERVAWTETRNLATNNPEMAGKVFLVGAGPGDPGHFGMAWASQSAGTGLPEGARLDA